MHEYEPIDPAEHLGLAITKAASFRTQYLTHLEKVSIAFERLVVAAEMFNPKLGFEFSSYVCPAIIRELIRAANIEGEISAREASDEISDRGSSARRPVEDVALAQVTLENFLHDISHANNLTDKHKQLLVLLLTPEYADLSEAKLGEIMGVSHTRVHQYKCELKTRLRLLFDRHFTQVTD